MAIDKSGSGHKMMWAACLEELLEASGGRMQVEGVA